MDKETRKKIEEILLGIYEFGVMHKGKGGVVSKAYFNKKAHQIDQLYHKPKEKPPLLNDGERKFLERRIVYAPRMCHQFVTELLQAQLDICVKHYEG